MHGPWLVITPDAATREEWRTFRARRAAAIWATNWAHLKAFGSGIGGVDRQFDDAEQTLCWDVQHEGVISGHTLSWATDEVIWESSDDGQEYLKARARYVKIQREERENDDRIWEQHDPIAVKNRERQRVEAERLRIRERAERERTPDFIAAKKVARAYRDFKIARAARARVARARVQQRAQQEMWRRHNLATNEFEIAATHLGDAAFDDACLRWSIHPCPAGQWGLWRMAEAIALRCHNTHMAAWPHPDQLFLVEGLNANGRPFGMIEICAPCQHRAHAMLKCAWLTPQTLLKHRFPWKRYVKEEQLPIWRSETI